MAVEHLLVVRGRDCDRSGALLAGGMDLREELRLAILVGLLGGFTTFSTFGYETYALLTDGRFGAAAVYVLASNLFGVGAVFVSYRLTERLTAA